MKIAAMLTSTPRRRRLTLAFALLAVAGGAIATLRLPAGPMPGDGIGPGLDAMHDGDIGPLLPRVLERARPRLGLDAEQQQLWDRAEAQSRSLREASRTGLRQARETLVAELAKDQPDLEAVVGTVDPVQRESQAERRKLRDLWLGVYGRLTPEQKGTVRDLLRERLARAEAFHDRLRDVLQQRRAASSR